MNAAIICACCFLAALAGFWLARWIYRTPPKQGEWPKAITSDGDLHEDWEDALFIESVHAANTPKK